MANMYRIETKKFPTGPMLGEIEESCSFLIELAKSAKLDLGKILNHTTKNGVTLFFDASAFSNKLTTQLLTQNVKVNSIGHNFVTPYFFCTQRAKNEKSFTESGIITVNSG